MLRAAESLIPTISGTAPTSLQEKGKRKEKKMKEFDPAVLDFDNPSPLFRFEDWLKGLIGGPLYYEPHFRSQGGFRGDEQVLDFGCGGGVGTRSIAASLAGGGAVTGVDPSSYFTEKARRRLEGFANARILQGEIGELDLPRRSFDLITIIHVLHDIVKDKRRAAIGALEALLKPKGRLWIYEPTRASHGMPAEEIRGLMAEAGLREVSGEEQKSSYRGIFEK
jgi:ubiquinone/menaquinone biosynthesis C-methylase UbiE